MTTSCGASPRESVATMSSTLVSAASATEEAARLSRSARSLTCAVASSPGDVDDASAGARERRRGLDQERRLADAGIAADEKHGAPDETASRHAVEFGDAGSRAHRLLGRALHRLEVKRTPFAAVSRARARGSRHRRRAGCVLLGHRVPAAAGVAFALPAPVDGPAGLADEDAFVTSHEVNLCRGEARPNPWPCASELVSDSP